MTDTVKHPDIAWANNVDGMVDAYHGLMTEDEFVDLYDSVFTLVNDDKCLGWIGVQHTVPIPELRGALKVLAPDADIEEMIGQFISDKTADSMGWDRIGPDDDDL